MLINSGFFIKEDFHSNLYLKQKETERQFLFNRTVELQLSFAVVCYSTWFFNRSKRRVKICSELKVVASF